MFIILALAAFIGVPMLHVFGISLSALQVAGGMVLTWMGFSLLRGPGAKADADSSPEGDSSLTPLILFAASPGTITGVITIVVDHGRQGLPLTALFGIAVAVAITLLMMLAAIRASGRKSGDGLMQSVGSRFMELIVLSMGLQFALSGYKAFVAGGG